MTEKPLTVFAPEGAAPDETALAQLDLVMRQEQVVAAALCADHHLGYVYPIGAAVAIDGGISPAGVGYDIACGNKATLTPLTIDDLPPATLRRVMDEIQRKISFGMGRSNPDPVDHDLFDRHADTLRKLDGFAGRREPLSQKARKQLGTVGGGNHYVDVLADELGRVWVANHFGSRGLGHTIATGFLNLGNNAPFSDRGGERDFDTMLDADSELGQFYIAAMHLAGDYAYAGRDYVNAQVLAILGTEPLQEIHLHHNFAWLEHGLWVVRKGATPLVEGDLAFIGGSMGDGAVIVRRKEDPTLGQIRGFAGISFAFGSDLDSAPHGAGRLMSRTKAAGKMKRSTRYVCQIEDCEHWLTPQAHHEQLMELKKQGGHADPRGGGVRCPHHPDKSLQRRGHLERKSDGVVDWTAVQAGLWSRGIELRGAGADEAPEVYKQLDAVIAAHPAIEVVHRLEPLGVVMAGPDIDDPYKD